MEGPPGIAPSKSEAGRHYFAVQSETPRGRVEADAVWAPAGNRILSNSYCSRSLPQRSSRAGIR